MENFYRPLVRNIPTQALEKWSFGALSEGFVPFPKKLLRCLHRLYPDVEAMKDIAALLAIVDFKRAQQPRAPSPDYLAFIAGLERSEFETALQRLENKGYVKVTRNADSIDVALGGLLDAIERETSRSP